jgi:hypothetical protein
MLIRPYVDFILNWQEDFTAIGRLEILLPIEYCRWDFFLHQ